MSQPTPHRSLTQLRPAALMRLGLSLSSSETQPPEIDGFKIDRLIGRGGMGLIYLARQLSLDREVCVKLIATEWADDPLFLARLEREAHTMAKLRHPNIVTIHHFEPLDKGGAALVMEYVSGGNLRDRLRDCPDGMPVPEAISRTREIASALGAAHNSGVIHRDVKPENILIDRDQNAARVTDFGLAIPLDGTSTQLTLSGTTVGTLDYLAPERFRSATTDARGDIYALGVVLYEMLTGEVPRGNFATPRQLRAAVPESLRSR